MPQMSEYEKLQKIKNRGYRRGGALTDILWAFAGVLWVVGIVVGIWLAYISSLGDTGVFVILFIGSFITVSNAALLILVFAKMAADISVTKRCNLDMLETLEQIASCSSQVSGDIKKQV